MLPFALYLSLFLRTIGNLLLGGSTNLLWIMTNYDNHIKLLSVYR